ncbi:MAG: hypothetical protein H0V47_04075 [Chloroflexia bacterium]|nr:hypothetical protein [Chloroflexia bacterium]
MVISGARTATSRSRLYRGGWLVLVLAFASYLLVAVAEQGGVGAGVQAVPDEPLPFRRHAGVGIDLSELSSLLALEWLEGTQIENAPMLLLPVDGDIVAAFNEPETFSAARAAIDSLIDASGNTPVTLCLHRPVSATEESVLAEAIVTVIVEDYTDSVAYLSICPGETSDTWQASVLGVLGIPAGGDSQERLLAPVSIGAPILLTPAIQATDLDDNYIDQLAGLSYVGVTLDNQTPLSETLRDEINDVLNDRAHVALVLARPHANVTPQDFATTMQLNEEPLELSEGYNDVLAPAISLTGEWTPTEVGPVLYQSTTQTGASLSADFVGTEVWAVGIVSPGAGKIGVWVDTDQPVTSRNPDNIVDLSGSQAVDRSMLLIDGLPAATHSITIVASEGNVTLAGLFVTGRPEPGWHGGLGALGTMGIAMAGLAVIISVAVDDLRLRIGLDRTDDQETDHPRIFRREL